jgi:LAO/AO transport system kinase
MGDEVQAFKAGLLEIADVLVVNKADREEAARTVLALQAMQAVAPADVGHHGPASGAAVASGPGRQPDGSWLPPILKTIAATGEGVETLHEWVEEHTRYLHETGHRAQQDTARAAATVRRLLAERLTAALLAALPMGRLDELTEAVARHRLDPDAAVARLMAHDLRRPQP